MMTRRSFSKAMAVAGAMPLAARAAATAPVSIGSRRELFLDRELIADMRGVDLRLATPVDGGPALQLDRPWEGQFSNYTTVLHENNRYRLYYRGTPVSKDGGSNEV